METTPSFNIKVYDDFLSNHEKNYVSDYCKSSGYCYGEMDSRETKKITGMVNEIYSSEKEYLEYNEHQQNFLNIFISKIELQLPEKIKDLNLYRMYVNCFAPAENPYFHTDGHKGEVTFLYYPNDFWDINDGGETQLYLNGTLYGIPPIPNRMIVFDADVLHKATSFRDRHRFTIAFKYGFPTTDNKKIFRFYNKEWTN